MHTATLHRSPALTPHSGAVWHRRIRRCARAVVWAVLCGAAVCWTAACPAADPELPVGPAPPAEMFAHFPDSMHAFVWRNWHAVEPERIAGALGTSVENVATVAESMGLPPAVPIPPQQRARGQFWMTLLRRNWHLAPSRQIAALLGISETELAEYVRGEDVANWSILGGFKPQCPPLCYEPPDESARRRAARIKQIVAEEFADELRGPGEPRFAFVRRLSEPLPAAPSASPKEAVFSPRIIGSCLKIVGDPLLDPQLESYPEGLLQRLAAVGVDGVWLFAELAHLAPGGETFPEFGENWQTRLENLRRLIQRCRPFGIGVYLYLNEPRAMPPSFFQQRPALAGTRHGDRICLCTSQPAVRQWLTDATAHLFREAPGLAGVFLISDSENQTHCAWRGAHQGCPRCAAREYADIVAEVNATIAAGAHRVDPDAKVLAWDWGWHGHGDAADVIARLPKSVWLMSVSEWSLPIQRGGVETAVGEYSISAVGPGPRALRHWKAAGAAGLKTAAKVQVNNTWELSSVPYLPVLDLVAEHCRRLTAAGVDGVMLSWTLGGYPSPNLEVAYRFNRKPVPSVEEVLDAVARNRFGPEGSPHARHAWTALSRAFSEYPYHIATVYTAPVQLGPANLLYPIKTGWRATMTGFPYDHLDAWRGPYPPEIFAAQYEKVADGWLEGLRELEAAAAKAPPANREEAQTDLSFARAARLHFASVANQTRFIVARDRLADPGHVPAGDVRRGLVEQERKAVEAEIQLAKELYALSHRNSALGFEPFCQYFYLPLDLVEKVVACRWLLSGDP
ncbi:MAG: hypothetical protein HUU20_18830 [Pirellulales bacterium]|nr:hypothetical protein [Pirellulales bacterium]